MSATKGFCHVTLCGRLKERPVISDPPLTAIVVCEDGEFTIQARGIEAKSLVAAGINRRMLVRGLAKVVSEKSQNGSRHRYMVIEARSVRLLDAQEAEIWPHAQG